MPNQSFKFSMTHSPATVIIITDSTLLCGVTVQVLIGVNSESWFVQYKCLDTQVLIFFNHVVTHITHVVHLDHRCIDVKVPLSGHVENCHAMLSIIYECYSFVRNIFVYSFGKTSK